MNIEWGISNLVYSTVSVIIVIPIFLLLFRNHKAKDIFFYSLRMLLLACETKRNWPKITETRKSSGRSKQQFYTEIVPHLSNI
jgi:hypothetical protein